jgi:putative CTP synthase (UTP-ammonia lyase)
MNDVWVWDVFRTNRFVKNVRAFSTRDVNVEERLPNQDFTVPEIADLPDDLG